MNDIDHHNMCWHHIDINIYIYIYMFACIYIYVCGDRGEVHQGLEEDLGARRLRCDRDHQLEVLGEDFWCSCCSLHLLFYVFIDTCLCVYIYIYIYNVYIYIVFV